MPKEISFQSVLDGRVSTYSMLSRLYRKEVSQSYLDELLKMSCPINTGNADADAGYRLFHHYLSHVWERTLEDLDRDYLRTFIGYNTTGHAAAYPNESIHTSPDRLMMQDARDEVRAIYRAAGLVNCESWTQGEDHIAIELEYMQIEAQRAADCSREGKDAEVAMHLMRQYHFLMDHLIPWVPFLVRDMLKFSETEFYQGLAYLTRGFLDVDREFLESVLADDIEAAHQKG